MNHSQDPLDRLLKCASQARKELPAPSAAVTHRVLAALRSERAGNPLQDLIPVFRIGFGLALACFLIARYILISEFPFRLT